MQKMIATLVYKKNGIFSQKIVIITSTPIMPSSYGQKTVVINKLISERDFFLGWVGATKTRRPINSSTHKLVDP
jgi:hypothetical protein